MKLSLPPFFFFNLVTCAACEILVPQPGTELTSSAVKVLSPNHRLPGNSPYLLLYTKKKKKKSIPRVESKIKGIIIKLPGANRGGYFHEVNIRKNLSSSHTHTKTLTIGGKKKIDNSGHIKIKNISIF